MNINQIKYLLTIYNEGSVTKAAEKLHVSQPSLSNMIKNIEDEIGEKIFKRTSPISLTYCGDVYFDSIKKIYEVHETLMQKIDDIQNHNRGKLRLGIAPQRGMLVLPEILPTFFEKFPLVEVGLDERGSVELQESILKGELDIAFITATPINNDLEYLLIENESMLLLSGPNTDISKRIENGTMISIAETKDESYISVRHGHSIREIQDTLFKNGKVSPRIILETSRLETAIKATLTCKAVTICSSIYIPFGINKKKDFFYPIDTSQYTQRNFYICYRKGAILSKFMREFIDIALSNLRDKAK
jgi:DNA-binding transcriptional LysR family regulator